MTYSSVIAAATTLLSSGVTPALVTIARLDQRGARVPSTDCPAVLFDTPSDDQEVRLAGGIGGYKEAAWWLDLHVWNYSDPLATTGVAFTDLVDSIKARLRGNTRMGGTGDTATSQVLIANDRLRTRFSRPLQGSGGIVRHCLISSYVREVYAA